MDVKFQWKDDNASKLKVNIKDEVVYLTFPELDKIPAVLHGFSTRIGGVSDDDCASMNLSFGRGDRQENVRQNFRIISDAIGFAVDSIVCSDQTHTTNIQMVTKADRGKGILRRKSYRDIDGLITNEPGVTLATFYADCVPLYLVDPVKGAVGLSHSGWKGTVGKIGKATVEAMVSGYHSDPSQIITAIGPSICMDCYEVSEDVIEEFSEAFTEKECRSMILEKGNGKYQLDLWRACEIVFLEAGILPEHIIKPNLCTCCNFDLLFSHRATAGRRGNLAAFLSLNK